MISLLMAKILKESGLTWKPALHDFFAIPDRGLDDQVFVISDVQVTVERMQDEQMLAFQGASEWALDSIITSESVWLPREDQLRQSLEEMLLQKGRPELRLTSGLTGYRCEFQWEGKLQVFDSRDASEAYAQAVMFVLKKRKNRAIDDA
jgi:hypothetical protein